MIHPKLSCLNGVVEFIRRLSLVSMLILFFLFWLHNDGINLPFYRTWRTIPWHRDSFLTSLSVQNSFCWLKFVGHFLKHAFPNPTLYIRGFYPYLLVKNIAIMHRNEGLYKPGASLLEFVFLMGGCFPLFQTMAGKLATERRFGIHRCHCNVDIYEEYLHKFIPWWNRCHRRVWGFYESLLDDTVCLGCGPLPVTECKSWQMKAYRNLLRNM